MRSVFAVLRQLVLPAGSPLGTPRTVIGPDVPPELVAFYATESATVYGMILNQASGTDYTYDGLAVGAGIANRVVGRVTAGVVNEVYRIIADVSVSVLQYGTRSPRPAVIFNNSGTQLILANSAAFRVDTPATATLYGDFLSARAGSWNAASATGTTTSASNVNLPGNPQVTLQKEGTAAQTRLQVGMAVGSFSTVGGTAVRFAVSATGVGDTDIRGFFHNAANTHADSAGVAFIAGVGAGTITVTGRWRRISGTGTLSVNADDWVSIWVKEVPV